MQSSTSYIRDMVFHGEIMSHLMMTRRRQERCHPPKSKQRGGSAICAGPSRGSSAP